MENEMEKRLICLGDQVQVDVFGATAVGQVIAKTYSQPVRFDVEIKGKTVRSIPQGSVSLIEGVTHG